jgi:hypothetical protein
MSGVRPPEWTTLTNRFPNTTLVDGVDGTALVAIENVDLPQGWSLSETSVRFLVPIGYPASQPDCFWAAPELRLASGAIPRNAGQQVVPGDGQPGLWFSWHITRWRPSFDTLTTYVQFVIERFADAS